MNAWSLCAVGLLTLPLTVPSQVCESGSLTELEQLAGWHDLLDDGLAGWRGTHAGTGGLQIGPGWSYADGVLTLAAGGQGGDLLSPGPFEDFELQFEWRVTEGSNSGVKVRVPYDKAGQPRIGPEYQILDDAGHPDGRAAMTSAAALYGLVAPAGKPDAKMGEFRRGRIVARGDHLEHWLDGVRVVDAELGSTQFETAKMASKFAALPAFGRGSGRVLLQDHGDEVCFRRVFIRDLSALPGQPADLDLGPELRGWSRVGDAGYTADGVNITGEVTGGKQSFLHTDRLFGDFILDVDVKLDVAGNSGIQVRSTVNHETGVLSGYQIEIDPSERNWSGGLYDERGRGWLDDLSEDALARAAFDPVDWNSYHIECIGPSLRAWVNGVPTANHLDAMTLEGVIGLQVHSGSAGRIRWRNLRIRDLGQHGWEMVSLEPSGSGAGSVADTGGAWSFPLADDVGDLSLRIRYAGDGLLELLLRAAEGEAVADGGVRDVSEEVLHRTEHGTWVVTPLMSTDAASTVEEHVLEVHAYGDRIAVVQDGKTIADRACLQSASRGACVLKANVSPGQSLKVLGVDRLVRVPQGR